MAEAKYNQSLSGRVLDFFEAVLLDVLDRFENNLESNHLAYDDLQKNLYAFSADKLSNEIEWFPDILVFQVLCELNRHNIDYTHIFRLFKRFSSDCIGKGKLLSADTDVFLACTLVVKDEFEKCKMFNILIEAYLENENVKNAWNCIRLTPIRAYRNEGKAKIARYFINKGKVNEARRVFALIEGGKGIVSTLESDLGVYYAKNQFFDDADAAFTRSIRYDVITGFYSLNYLMNKMIEIHWPIPDYLFLDISEYIDDIHYPWNKISACIAISSVHYKYRKLDKAEAYLNTAKEFIYLIDSIYLKCSAYIELADELCKQGKFEDASLHIDYALDCAIGITDFFWQAIALKNCYLVLRQYNNSRAALVLRQAINCACNIDNINRKLQSMMHLAITLHKVDCFVEAEFLRNRALQMSLQLNPSSINPQVFSTMAKQHCELGKFSDAIELIRYCIVSDVHMTQ